MADWAKLAVGLEWRSLVCRDAWNLRGDWWLCPEMLYWGFGQFTGVLGDTRCGVPLANGVLVARTREGGSLMGVEKVGEKYRCNVCGNEVTVSKVGGGTLVCCGEDMEKVE